MTRPIVFLTDYGIQDEYVGVCHAVVARLAPDVPVIDLMHSIPPGDVLAGALVLADSVSFVPSNAVFLAVVDPGVGTGRRAVAVEAGSAVLVGPDNGLMSLAIRALGGAGPAVELESGAAPWPESATFHGRDLFAPAAARIAAGEPIEALGRPIEPAGLVALVPPEATVEGRRLSTTVLAVDRFGNARLGARADDLGRAGLAGDASVVLVAADGRHETLVRARTFAEVPEGKTGLLIDSGGWLAVVRNAASAAEALHLARGDAVTVGPGEMG